jgi:hypothetical protein
VAVLGLLALFTHTHLFWIAALLLALIDLPDFGTPLRSIAGSVEKIADSTEGAARQEATDEESAAEAVTASDKTEPSVAREPAIPKKEVRSHA